VTATLPRDVQDVFERFITTEYTTVDRTGQPITWPVTPYYKAGDGAIDVTTGLGYPKKADDAEQNPQIGLLFSDPTGSGLERPCAVLVQGTAQVDYSDLDANRERYWRESGEKLPATKEMHPPSFLRGQFNWYYTRIYVYVRPERVFVWSDGDFSKEPTLYGTHLEEAGGPPEWDARLDELGQRHDTAVLTLVGPDGFPFSLRLPIRPDRAAHRVRLGELPDWLPATPSKACLTAHAHGPRFEWQANFQVRGDLVQEAGDWSLVPHRLVGGFELPQGKLQAYRENLGKMLRFRKRAKAELAKRAG
jgi:hypothetical protein